MASESIGHEAYDLKGYWLRAHSDPIIAELWHAKRACGAPWVSKIYPSQKIWWSRDRATSARPPARCPPVRLQHRATNAQSHPFLLVWEHRKTDIAHILHINVVINWQLSKQGICWPVSPDRIAGSGVDPSRSSIFLKLSAYKLLVFKWLQAQVIILFNLYWLCCVLYVLHN